MKPSEIRALWDKDCQIDPTDYERAAIQKPRLHSKYLNMLIDVKLELRNAEIVFLKMRTLKGRYYSGELTKDELQERGWPQYQKNKPLKTELEKLLESDPDMMECVNRLEVLKVAQMQLEYILKEVSGRDWTIRNAIEWHKFTQGG